MYELIEIPWLEYQYLLVLKRLFSLLWWEILPIIDGNARSSCNIPGIPGYTINSIYVIFSPTMFIQFVQRIIRSKTEVILLIA